MTHETELSPDARAYIASLHDSQAREAAREYARMDPHSFQARIGPGLDELDKKTGEILTELRRRRGFDKRLAAAFIAVGGVIAEGATRVLGQHR